MTSIHEAFSDWQQTADYAWVDWLEELGISELDAASRKAFDAGFKYAVLAIELEEGMASIEVQLEKKP